MDWAEALPPPELTEFLRGIKLPQYDGQLAALGYDDVDDFSNFDEAARTRLRAALEGENIPGGHVDKPMPVGQIDEKTHVCNDSAACLGRQESGGRGARHKKPRAHVE